jgi:pyridoxine 4-dehydrogenase
MGLGAWAWGDSLFWGYDSKNDAELKNVFDFAVAQATAAAASGSGKQDSRGDQKVLLDTAEIYGFGRSETLIGQFAKAYPRDKIQVTRTFTQCRCLC